MVLEKASKINNNLNNIIILTNCKFFYYYQFNFCGEKYTEATRVKYVVNMHKNT